jgi:hypothetical protein
MAVRYGDLDWLPPNRKPLARCAFWTMPEVHHGFPSPWRWWLETGLLAPDAFDARAGELHLLARALAFLDLPALGAASRVCRAWRTLVHAARDVWLNVYAALERPLDLPRLGATGGDGGGLGSLGPRLALRAVLVARRAACALMTQPLAVAQPHTEAQIDAHERGPLGGVRLPLDARELLKIGGVALVREAVAVALGAGWVARVCALEGWVRADEALARAVWPRLGPVGPPRAPALIGEATRAASSAAALEAHAAKDRDGCLVADAAGERAQLVLYDGALFLGIPGGETERSWVFTLSSTGLTRES